MNFYVAILLVLASLKPLFAQDKVDSAKDNLANAVASFNKDNCRAALKYLFGVNVSTSFDNSDEMQQALKIRAICASETGDDKMATESIRELYFLDPNYRFNAFDTPAPVIELATKELKKIEEKNRELARSTKIKEPVPKKNNKEINLTIEKPNFGTAFFPFGINHYLMNAPLKGSIYLSLQSLGLLGNIGAYWWKQSYLSSFGSSRLMNAREKNVFTTAQTIQYLALGTFIVALGSSIIDAIVHLSSSTQNSFSSQINP